MKRRESVADDQIPRFKDIQKLIATKLEFSKVNKEAINDASTATTRAFAHVHKNISAIKPPPPPPPARTRVIDPKSPAIAEYGHHRGFFDPKIYSTISFTTHLTLSL